MKQIYLFLLIIVGINASAQTNCNIGNFERTTEFTANATIGQNSNSGSLYSVENTGTVSALNVHFPDGGVLFKLYLYKRLNNGNAYYITSTALTTSVAGGMSVAVPETVLEPGDYFIFLNVDTTSRLYIKEAVVDRPTFLFRQLNSEAPITETALYTSNFYELLMGMTFTCDPSAVVPPCTVNQIDTSINFENVRSEYSYFMPFTVVDAAPVSNFRVQNSVTEGQFRLAIYSFENNVLSLVTKTAITNPVLGMQVLTPETSPTLAPGKYYLAVSGDENYKIHYRQTNTSTDVFRYLSLSTDLDLPTSLHNSRLLTTTGTIFPIEINYACSTASATDFNQSKMAVYPNPATNNIQIAGLTQDVKYGIFNVLGAQVASGMASENTSINIDKLSNGMYIIKLENGQNIKFIKE